MNYSKDKVKFHKVYNFPGTHTSFVTGKLLSKVKSFDERCVFSNN